MPCSEQLIVDRLSFLPLLGIIRIFGIPIGASDGIDEMFATLEFTDGKLNNSPLTKNVNVDSANKVTNAPVTDKSFVLKITSAIGKIGGSFVHSDNTKPAFTGVIFQKGPNAGAYGYFLGIPPKSGTGESGGVTLTTK